jgi:hypothetical protein
LIAIYQHEVSLNALNSETHGKLRRLEYVDSLDSTWTHRYNRPARRGFLYLFEKSVPLFRGESLRVLDEMVLVALGEYGGGCYNGPSTWPSSCLINAAN